MMIKIRGIVVLLTTLLFIILKSVHATSDVVAQNYAAARSAGIQSCTVGYNVLSGDVNYQQQLITGKLPYSFNYKAPLRLNISSAQEFAQPENSTLGWSDNYQSSILIQRISTKTTQYQSSRFYYKTSSSKYYTYETSNPVTTTFNAKVIFVRLPGEQTSQIFKEENGQFQRLESADAMNDFNSTAIQQLNWKSSLGGYSLSWSGNNLIIQKYGTKFTVTSSSHVIAPSATYNDTIYKYLDASLQEQETSSFWSTSSATRTNTALYLQTSATSSIDLHRIENIEVKGQSLKMQYDGRMNLNQVSDQYNNKIVLERNFHESSSGSTQTIDESRLVTKATYTATGQTTSQVAEFKYQSYDVSTPSTGIKSKVYALTESNSTGAGKTSFISTLTELGAIKAYVARKGRTSDASYNYPVLTQVKNSLDQIVRQWNITQNYLLATDGTYSIAQTTLRSFTPNTTNTAYDNTSIYNDIDRTITTSIALGNSTGTNTLKSTLSGSSLLKVEASGYPCLSFGKTPIKSAEFSIPKSQLLQITDAKDHIANINYDYRDRLSGILEANGTSVSRNTSYIYGSAETSQFDVPVLIAIFTPDSSQYTVVTNTVNAQGNITSQTQTSSQSGSTSKVTTYSYDETATSKHFARLISVDGPRTGTADKITYSYDNFGNLASQSQTVNGAVRTTQYLNYNTFGNPERIVHPTGLVDQFVYNADGTLKSQTTGVGGATGAITGQTTSFTYNALKQKISETSPDGEITQFTYDLAGRLTQITLPNGNKVQKNYYSIGALASEKNLTSAGVVASESYQYLDSKGFVSKIQQGSDPTRQFTTFSYDNNGNLTQTTSAAGIIEKWSYDALNRMVSHTDGAGNVDTTAYDVNDNVTVAKDALNAGTNPFSYRNGKTLTQEVNSDYGTKTYSYNEADQLTQRLHGARKCNFNNLDELGRYRAFACTANSGTTASEYQINDNYTYDQSRYGRLDKVSTGLTGYDVDTSYSYDAYDRVTAKATINQLFNRYAVKTGQSLNVNYGYSIGGKPTALTLPSGRTITYVYNAQGMLSSINLYGNPLIRNISYDGANRVTGWLWSSAGNASYSQSYNNDGSTNNITNKNSAGTTNYSLTYGYDKVGRITQLTRNNGTKDNYGYDNVDRLTSESRTTGTTQTYSITYTYDKNGNRTSLTATGQHMQPAASATYSYSGNKLSSFSKGGVGQSISHTDNGELTHGATPTYDNGARRKVDRISSTDYYYMNYNHKNERSFKNRVLNSAITTMTQYIYDEQSHLIGEYDKLGAQVEYVWLGDKPIAAIYGSGAATKIYYIVTDHLNTPRRLIDSATHAIAWSWDSTAFGLGNPTGTVTFNLRFPGQYFDAATGHFYNHNRYYNPELGRYMEPDPIGLEGGLNPYAYAGSNPVMNVDPSGLLFQELSEKALRTPNLDMPSIPQPIFDALMGAANSASFGIGQPFSNWVNGYPTANMDSSAYKLGEYGSVAGGVGGLVVNGARSIIREVGVSVWDMASPTVSRTVLRQRDPSIITPDNFFQGARYTDKVKTQASSGDYHSFPQAIDGFASIGKVSRLQGGDKLYRWKLEIPGAYRGKDGIFEYIRNHNGTINHRLFEPNKK
ncbi:RHS repeat domain-containing protein [Acinetobacter beijerinckii]|nr:RHS repeat-associated core domain-containing protein [Acinetobacter beijerinckii]